MCKCMILHLCDKNMKEQQIKWTQGFKRWVTGRCHPQTLLRTACGLSSKENNSPTMWCIRCRMIHHLFWPLFMGRILLHMTKKNQIKRLKVWLMWEKCVWMLSHRASHLRLNVFCVFRICEMKESDVMDLKDSEKWVRPNAMQLFCECVMAPLLVRRLALDTIFPSDFPKHKI